MPTQTIMIRQPQRINLGTFHIQFATQMRNMFNTYNKLHKIKDRKLVFRGRGSRKHLKDIREKRMNQSDLPIKDATHVAVYLVVDKVVDYA